MSKVIDILNELKLTNTRACDFISVLNGIINGDLNGNISVPLLLDVGHFIRQGSVHSVRYSDTTKTFWTLVQTLFMGRGIRFYKGLKGDGLGAAG